MGKLFINFILLFTISLFLFFCSSPVRHTTDVISHIVISPPYITLKNPDIFPPIEEIKIQAAVYLENGGTADKDIMVTWQAIPKDNIHFEDTEGNFITEMLTNKNGVSEVILVMSTFTCYEAIVQACVKNADVCDDIYVEVLIDDCE